jgi:hypothetical protein
MLNSVQERHEQAIASLVQQHFVQRPEEVVESLVEGLSMLRNLLLTRVHEDVATYFGIDSMLSPMSEKEERKVLHRAKVEIEVFSIAIAADEGQRSSYLGDQSVCLLKWLLQLRLGDEIPEGVRHRLGGYLNRSSDEQRLLFTSVIEHTIPEAKKAPLLIFRLFPEAVRIALAVAFRDPLRAAELRNKQSTLLPAIGYCHTCHGYPLDNGEMCSTCGNPLWTIKWLRDTD